MVETYQKLSAQEQIWKNRSELDGIRALWLAVPVPFSAAILILLHKLGYELALCGAVAVSVHSLMLPAAFLGFSRYAERRIRNLASTEDVIDRERLVKEEFEAELHYVERLNITTEMKARLVERALAQYEYKMQVIEDHRRLGYRPLSPEQVQQLRGSRAPSDVDAA
jgi:hypothetical protein